MQKSFANHWVMLYEKNGKLVILPEWDPKMMRRTRHFCGRAHASRYVERWIAGIALNATTEPVLDPALRKSAQPEPAAQIHLRRRRRGKRPGTRNQISMNPASPRTLFEKSLPKTQLRHITADRIQYECLQPKECRQEQREGVLTRYRIYRNSAGETTYISTHDSRARQDPQKFPNLNVALAVLRESGIPEYEIRRVTKELAAINGAIVQVPETLIFDHATEQSSQR